MIPSAPTAHFSKPPPVNMLYIPSKPLPRFAAPDRSRPSSARRPSRECGTRPISRQIPNTISVNKIRDFSSGILKQLLNVLRMDCEHESSVTASGASRRFAASLPARRPIGRPRLAFNLCPGRGAESVRCHRQFPGQFAVPRILIPSRRSVGQARWRATPLHPRSRRL